MIIFNTLAVCGSGLLFLCVYFAPSELPMLSVVLFGLVNIALGAGCGGEMTFLIEHLCRSNFQDSTNVLCCIQGQFDCVLRIIRPLL